MRVGLSQGRIIIGYLDGRAFGRHLLDRTGHERDAPVEPRKGFYGRFGFVPEPGLTLPGVPAEYFMARSFGAAMPSGEVCYHPAFVQE